MMTLSSKIKAEKTPKDLTPPEVEELPTRKEFNALWLEAKCKFEGAATEEELAQFGKSADYRRAMMRLYMESIATDLGIIPPYWTGALYCKQCRYMPCEPQYEGTVVESCSWCPSDTGSRLKEVYKVGAARYDWRAEA